MLRTDYAGHDARYRELRDQGAPGWDTADEYREREIELAWAQTGRWAAEVASEWYRKLVYYTGLTFAMCFMLVIVILRELL